MKATGSVILMFFAGVTLFAQTPASTWLDKPLTNWNAADRTLPAAKPGNEKIPELSKRCSFLPLLQSTAGERALVAGGWIPFQIFDRRIVERDVEIIGGLAAADGMCRPMNFNVFVFVNGRLAGTLSPQLMMSRADASIGGAVRISADDTIDAAFARYLDKDALCCPSSHVTVRYRIDRTAKPPLVVPETVRVTRK